MVNRLVWTPLHTRVHRTLQHRQLLKRQERILIAVSGGQDSLCLTKLLLDLQLKWGWQLAIAHCDHRWSKDVGIAAHVEQIARNWQLPFYLQTADYVTESEGAAREWRYQALTKVASSHSYQYIVTGHTKSDRAETLIYNLIRGAGADGLQALTWQRLLTPELQLVRPLLEVSRAETFQFCQDFKLPIWEDVYNQDLNYARNRIRQQLLPYLQTHFNPQVEQALAQTAELLRADVEYLEQAAQNLRSQAMAITPESINHTQQNSDLSSLNRVVLRDAPIALQRRVLRQFLQAALSIAPTFEQIEQLTFLITAPNRSRTSSLPGGAISSPKTSFYAEVEGKWIRIKKTEL
ncbi:MAG TPA: tRNA lysidine(34) synthetase TilS [Candidatus Sericytochromatia bacterium]